jgi:hypothetical protein
LSFSLQLFEGCINRERDEKDTDDAYSKEAVEKNRFDGASFCDIEYSDESSIESKKDVDDETNYSVSVVSWRGWL